MSAVPLITEVAINQIRAAHETQMRIKISESVVEDYADAINDGAAFPPIDLPPAFVPDANIPEDDGRKVLIDSRWSWFEQTRRLKNRKAYVDDAEGGQ